MPQCQMVESRAAHAENSWKKPGVKKIRNNEKKPAGFEWTEFRID
jgi:hypothetical protein